MKIQPFKRTILAVTLFISLLAGVSTAGSNEELKLAQLENRVLELEAKVKKLSSDTNMLNVRVKELEKMLGKKSGSQGR